MAKYTEKQIRKAWKRATRAIEDPMDHGKTTIDILVDELKEYAALTDLPVFTVYADDGEYGVKAENIVLALAHFKIQHPRSFAMAIVDDAMRPRLVLEELGDDC
jgi:hypothetical protein